MRASYIWTDKAAVLHARVSCMCLLGSRGILKRLQGSRINRTANSCDKEG